MRPAFSDLFSSKRDGCEVGSPVKLLQMSRGWGARIGIQGLLRKSGSNKYTDLQVEFLRAASQQQKRIGHSPAPAQLRDQLNFRLNQGDLPCLIDCQRAKVYPLWRMKTSTGSFKCLYICSHTAKHSNCKVIQWTDLKAEQGSSRGEDQWSKKKADRE